MFRALLVCLCLPLPAFAEIVRFDAEAHCKQVAGFGGSYSNEMFNFCLNGEQRAYDALKSRWDAIAASIRTHCADVAAFGGPGSYEMLKFCVEQEEEAASSTPSFQY